MRKEVQFVPLRELCDDWKKDVVSGPFGSNLKREHFVSSGIPVLKIQNVKPLELKIKKLNYVTSEKAHELRRHSFERGDIVVTKLGSPLGAAAIVEELEQGIIVADLVRIRASKVDTKYLCYHINSPDSIQVLNGQQEGATRPRIKLDVLRDLPIYHPPLSEQKRIVSILDEAFGAIAKAKRIAEKNLSNAIELFDSYLNRVFTEKGEGWEETTLGDSCEFFNGKAHEKCIDEEGDYVVVNSKFISQEGRVRKHTSSQLFPLFEDDLVMVMSDVPKGKALAKCYLIEKDDTYTLNQRICAIRTERFHKRFLLHHLNRHPYLLAFDNKGSQANLRKIDILSCPLYMPSDEDQREIAAEIDAIHNDTRQVEAIYAKKNDCLDELKQSILQKAFTGQLTAKSPELEAVP